MRKSFMNIKNFVDSSVRLRIEKASNSNDHVSDDLLQVERQFEDLRQLCVEAEKRISSLLLSINSSMLGAYTQNVQASLSNLSQLTPMQTSSTVGDQQIAIKYYSNSAGLSTTNNNNVSNPSNQSRVDISQSTDNTDLGIRKHHKKLPIVGFLKFLVKSCHKLRKDSLLASTLTHCSQMQAQLTKLYMSYEQTIEAQCLKPIQQVLEIDVPNVIRLRKLFIKAHNDLESARSRHNGAIQKQQQQQQPLTAHFTSASYTITQSSTVQANINKVDLLKKELDDAEARFEQAKDIYAIELYTFVSREAEFVELFMKFYQHQAEYQAQASSLIHNSLPSLGNILATTPRKVVFGTPLDEHLKCTGRSVSILVELCIHLLYSNGLNEEGLFRVPGSSIKIRKLKSAINAWFVTLAPHSEPLENPDYEITQRQHKAIAAQQPTLLAIYTLFKEITSQKLPHHHSGLASPEANHNNQVAARDESHTLPESSAHESETRELVFDVHTVAGLLKLYLRELPEPLLGNALYDQWVDACTRGSDIGKLESLPNLKRVVDQLPTANFKSLRLLIRFLHLLTCHQVKNKMTATNLAIAMAPSLIWTPRISQRQLDPVTCPSDNQQQVDEIQALNMQMSNLGISASLHAMIIENLIRNAEQLFPGELEFTLPDLDEERMSLLTYSQKTQSSTGDRVVKSASPTGSSTESTSSFSSTSNISTCKKSGSIERLTPTCDGASPTPFRPARPSSVHINRIEEDKKLRKPPVPPAPANKSHSRQASDPVASIRRLASRKPPAPPIPSSTSTTNSTYHEDKSNLTTPSGISSSPHIIARPASLRGTGTTKGAVNTACNVSTRPSVPPPDRPTKSDQDGQLSSHKFASLTDDNVKDLKTSGDLKSGFEEINALDMIDDVDISDQTSPVVSLDDSISADDSSFDNQSLDHSWTECDSDKEKNHQTDSSNEEATMATKQNESKRTLNPDSRESAVPTNKDYADTEASPNTSSSPVRLAPKKPPRSSSPKTNAPGVMQSTLL